MEERTDRTNVLINQLRSSTASQATDINQTVGKQLSQIRQEVSENNRRALAESDSKYTRAVQLIDSLE